MDDLPLRLRTFLSEAAQRLRDARLPQDLGEAVGRLSGQVDQRCAVVDEHGQRTAEFLALQRQLRDRHNAETERLGGEADAVVYLIGQVARTTDLAFL